MHTCLNYPVWLLTSSLSGYADPSRVTRIIAYDVESFKVARGMTAWPLWWQEGICSPTWQYGLVRVDSYDAETCTAKITGTQISSRTHTDMYLDGSIKRQQYDGHAQFQ